jgi:cytochrome P450
MPHNTLSQRAHKCVGAPLGRMEMRVMLEELSQRMPIMRLDPDKPAPRAVPAPVLGLGNLHLVWDPQ